MKSHREEAGNVIRKCKTLNEIKLPKKIRGHQKYFV